MFTFFSSFFFLLLPAISIPIIIHLLFRRRYQRIRWAAMQFLLAAYRHTKTTLLLENLILLILRILLILFLIFLFARPIFRVTKALVTDTLAKDNYILVLDNSYSMGVRSENVSAFDRAKTQGRAIINKMQENDSISMITLNEVSKIELDFFKIRNDKEREQVLHIWDQIPITQMATDVEGSLRLVAQLVRNPDYSNKKIFVFTDLQKNAWEKTVTTNSILELWHEIRNASSVLTVVNVGFPNPQNLGIINLEHDNMVSLAGPNRFMAKIRNYSNQIYKDVAVMFFVDGQKQKTEYVSLAEDQEINVTFEAGFLQAGNHYITLQLPPDSLMLDNIRHLTFEVMDKINVLVVDGDPQTGNFASECDYLMAALGEDNQGLFNIRKVTTDQLSPLMSFAEYDVIVLANVAELDAFVVMEANQKTKLENFVDRGGGLWIWLGEKVSATNYNKTLYGIGRELLPAALDRHTGNINIEENKTTYSLDNFAEHRSWRYFQENKFFLEGLKKCLVYKYFTVILPNNDPNLTILATYTPGKEPAILERQFGRGKILLHTTTVDRHWANFHTDQYGDLFVIMVNELLQYLVLQPYRSHHLYVGSALMKNYDFYFNKIQILNPEDRSTVLESKVVGKSSTGKDIYRIIYANTEVSGIYRIRLSIPTQTLQERPELKRLILADPNLPSPEFQQLQQYFIVNPDPQEGNLQALSEEGFSQRLSGLDLEYKNEIASQFQEDIPIKDQEYWQYVIVILLMLAVAETFFAMWFGRYQK